MKAINQEESRYLYILKAFALVSIIGSHTVGVHSDSSLLVKSMSELMNIFGALGVGVFLLISGYLFASNKKDIKAFMVSKINQIIIPWVGAGLIVYFTTAITNIKIFEAGIISYLIGGFTQSVVTPLYFLVILFILYIVYFNFKNNTKFIYITIFLSVLAIFLTASQVIVLPNKYLNPFVFMIYFATGILIRNNSMTLLEIGRKFKKKTLLVALAYLVFISFCRVSGISLGYFGYGTLVAQLLGILTIMGISSYSIFNKNFQINIGLYSFFIYLFHMPVAWFVVRLTNYLHLDFLVLLRPFFVIIIFYSAITMTKQYKITKKTLHYLGVRE